MLFLFPVPAHNNNNNYNNRTTFSVDPDTHIDSIEQAEEMTIEGTSKWSCKIQITGIDAAFYEEQHADLHAELLLLLLLFAISTFLCISGHFFLYLYLCNYHFFAQTRSISKYCYLECAAGFSERPFEGSCIDINRDLNFFGLLLMM